MVTAAAVFLAACGGEREAPPPAPAPVAPPIDAAPPAPPPERVVRVLEGTAIWYGERWQGKRTASGEAFDKEALTAAHRSLPFGTRVRVTHRESGRQVVVRINDRGPYGRDRSRVIDVSEAAARALGFGDAGSIPVRLEVLGVTDPPHLSEDASSTSAD